MKKKPVWQERGGPSGTLLILRHNKRKEKNWGWGKQTAGEVKKDGRGVTGHQKAWWGKCRNNCTLASKLTKGRGEKKKPNKGIMGVRCKKKKRKASKPADVMSK